MDAEFITVGKRNMAENTFGSDCIRSDCQLVGDHFRSMERKSCKECKNNVVCYIFEWQKK